MHNVEEVTDEQEKQHALVFLEGSMATPGMLVQTLSLPVLDNVCISFSFTLTWETG